MASTCISSCTNTVDHRAIVARASYVSLYKWPESDADFIRSINAEKTAGEGSAKAIDSVTSRQMYLRSYPFSRKQTLPERTKKCFEKVRALVYRGDRSVFRNPRVSVMKMKVVDLSCPAIWDVFRRLLACTTAKVDVADRGDR